jgi:hypothetical protein
MTQIIKDLGFPPPATDRCMQRNFDYARSRRDIDAQRTRQHRRAPAGHCPPSSQPMAPWHRPKSAPALSTRRSLVRLRGCSFRGGSAIKAGQPLATFVTAPTARSA